MTEISQWNALARALRELHAALVERARADYRQDNLIGRDIGPGELLRLLTTDPYFEWLRGLSELMVDIDLIRDKVSVAEQAEMAASVRAAIEHFFKPAVDTDAQNVFATRYWRYVQSDPHIAMAHAAVKRTLLGWPAPEAGEPGSGARHRQRLRDTAQEPKRRK